MKRKIVEVQWFDAQSTTDQMSVKEIEEFKHIQVIPRGMIEEINTIREEKKCK